MHVMSSYKRGLILLACDWAILIPGSIYGGPVAWWIWGAVMTRWIVEALR
jgi:hypothetical protein